jgi:hypothetical protein
LSRRPKLRFWSFRVRSQRQADTAQSPAIEQSHFGRYGKSGGPGPPLPQRHCWLLSLQAFSFPLKRKGNSLWRQEQRDASAVACPQRPLASHKWLGSVTARNANAALDRLSGSRPIIRRSKSAWMAHGRSLPERGHLDSICASHFAPPVERRFIGRSTRPRYAAWPSERWKDRNSSRLIRGGSGQSTDGCGCRRTYTMSYECMSCGRGLLACRECPFARRRGRTQVADIQSLFC